MTLVKGVRIHSHGGPDVMSWEDIELAPPGPGEARVRHTAIALNFSDINVRRGGFYQKDPLPMPIILGNEAAGVVESVGEGVTDVRVGERVGYVGVGSNFFAKTGAYAQQRNVPAERLVKLPETVSDLQAASVMLKGLTASNIINRIYRPAAGDTVLIHAAASGVGLVLMVFARFFSIETIVRPPSTAPQEPALLPEAPAPEFMPLLRNARGQLMEMAYYQVDALRRVEFMKLMNEIHHVRGRTGAVAWQLYEDVAHPDGWIEVWSMESWTEHLREGIRLTEDDKKLLTSAAVFQHEAHRPTRFLAVDPGEYLHTHQAAPHQADKLSVVSAAGSAAPA